ncbi:hypothetical protein RQP46_000016 [Phenoliferia psychrophenolica]
MQHIHIYPSAPNGVQGSGSGGYQLVGPGGGGIEESLDEHLPAALNEHLPQALEDHLVDAVESAINGAVEELPELVSEEVSLVIKPLFSFLQRTTNRARNRKRQTRGLNDLLPMPDEDGIDRPKSTRTRDAAGNLRVKTRIDPINTTDEILLLSDAQCRLWLKFLGEPTPSFAGLATPAAKLARLRDAVKDGFLGE